MFNSANAAQSGDMTGVPDNHASTCTPANGSKYVEAINNPLALLNNIRRNSGFAKAGLAKRRYFTACNRPWAWGDRRIGVGLAYDLWLFHLATPDIRFDIGSFCDCRAPRPPGIGS